MCSFRLLGSALSDSTRTCTAVDGPTHSGSEAPRAAPSGSSGPCESSSSDCQPDHLPDFASRVRT